MSDAEAARHKKKRKSKRARKVSTSSHRAVTQVVQSLSSPATADRGTPAPGLTAFLASVTAVRKEVTGHSHAERAAHTGLAELEKSLQLLKSAQATTDPNQALLTLQRSHAALRKSQAARKKAGHAWPL